MSPNTFNDRLILIYQSIIVIILFFGIWVTISSLNRVPVMFHRVWIFQEFQTPKSVTITLAFTLFLWALLTILQGVKPVFMVPVGILFCLSYFKPIFLGIAALGGVLISLYRFRVYQGVFRLFLGITNVLTVLSLFHWLSILVGWFAFNDYANAYTITYYLFAQLSPWLYIFLFIISPIGFFRRLSGYEPDKKTEDVRDFFSGNVWLAILVVCAFLVSAYPYSTFINPNSVTPGVDTMGYFNSYELVETDIWSVFSIYEGSRPTVFLLIYALRKLTGASVMEVLRVLPFLLNPLYVAASYWLTWETTRSRRTALWSSFFSLTGVQLTVGVFSYYISNILALIAMFLSLIFLVRYLRTGSLFSLTSSIFLGGLAVFTHPWTSDQYIGSAILTAIVAGYLEHRRGLGFIILRKWFTYILGVMVFYVIKLCLINEAEGAVTIISFGEKLTSFNELLFQLQWSTLYKYGGLMANSLALLLLIIGILAMKPLDDVKLYFHCFVLASSIVFLIGDASIKSRIIYNIPWGLYMAKGMTRLSQSKYSNLELLFFIGLSQSVYLLRSLANVV